MYADPTHARANPIKVRLNDEEYAVIESLARLNKRQPAVFARELLMRGIADLDQHNQHVRAA